MTRHDPLAEADDPTLHPGPRDEGGEGGMATRELHAHEAHHETHRDDAEDPGGRDDEGAPTARGD